MKPLSRAVTTAAVTAVLLLAGPAGLALAADSSTPAAEPLQSENSLQQMITLKPGTVEVFDRYGLPRAEQAPGLPALQGPSTAAASPIAASALFPAADGTSWRVVSLKTACTGYAAFFIPETAVATSAPATVPATELRADRDGGVLLAPCKPNAAIPFAVTPDAATVASVHKAADAAAIYNQMLHAATLAIDDRAANATDNAKDVVEAEPGGMRAAGVVMLAGGALVLGAAATGLAVAGIRGKKAKR
ncbi:hypothetical protein B5P43_15830 [Bacillus sp. SRB_336]|nr:hypothetical protein B5P43_15830 [Bacillus sp. SRB_336]